MVDSYSRAIMCECLQIGEAACTAKVSLGPKNRNKRKVWCSANPVGDIIEGSGVS